MNRKEFLFHFFQNLIVPTLWMVVIILSAQFLFSAWSSNGIERIVLYTLLAFISVRFIAMVLEQVYDLGANKIPSNSRKNLDKIRSVLKWITLPLGLVAWVYSLNTNWRSTVFLTLILVAQHVLDRTNASRI